MRGAAVGREPPRKGGVRACTTGTVPVRNNKIASKYRAKQKIKNNSREGLTVADDML